jgi:glycosyltransferase involved in cell wall biosynthesis
MTPASSAVFVMPRAPTEWGGAAALWVTVAGWADAAARRFGHSWVVTPDGTVDADAALAAAGVGTAAPAGSSQSARALARRLPTWTNTAAKDARRLVRARARRRAGDDGRWAADVPAFVWQDHDLFHRTGERIASRAGVPLVSYVHAPQVWEAARWGVRRPGWGPALERYGERPQLVASDVVACVSDEVASELGRFGVPDARILVSPMAVDATRFTPTVSGSRVRAAFGFEDAFVVGWVGSFRAFHGVETVVDAFADLHSRAPASRLLLAGSGTERDAIAARATERGVGDALVFPGQITHAEMPELLAALDAAVVSARAGVGFHYSPLKLREYLACGVPTVAPRAGEIPRTFVDGDHVLLYDVGDAVELAAALLRLHDDRALGARLGRAGRELIMASATWDIRLEDLLAFPAFVEAATRRAR